MDKTDLFNKFGLVSIPKYSEDKEMLPDIYEVYLKHEGKTFVPIIRKRHNEIRSPRLMRFDSCMATILTGTHDTGFGPREDEKLLRARFTEAAKICSGKNEKTNNYGG